MDELTTDQLVVDDRAANQGTARGRALLKESVQTVGFGRSAVVDKHGQVVVGNKVVQVAQELDAGVEVVQTDGHELVVVQRTDLDLGRDRAARQLAYYDNRVTEVDLSWSAEQATADLSAGVDLSVAFFPEELDRLTDLSANVPSLPEMPVVATPVAPVAVEEADAAEPVVATPVVAVPKPPTWKVRLSFEDGVARVQWQGLLRELEVRYPDAETAGEAFLCYLRDQGF